MLNLWKYKYFVDVVDYKSFTKAGKKNFVTQTAISQQISQLEKGIGEKLLERGNGELKMTEYGETVYRSAKEMLATYDKMLREIQHLREKMVIRVGVDNSINKKLWMKLQNIIDEYYAEEDFQFQKINLNLASKLIDEDELDAYIGYDLNYLHDTGSIKEELLAKNRVGIHVGAQTTLPVERELKLVDLKDHTRYGTMIYPCSIQEDAAKQCEDLDKETNLVSNIDTMKIKVEMNDGYMFADSYYFSYAEGDVFEISDYDAECELKVYYRSSDEKVVKFIQRLHKVLEEGE